MKTFRVQVGLLALTALQLAYAQLALAYRPFDSTDADVVVDGDFAMHENELQTVLKSMRKGGINIVAIHHHMSDEKPKFLFLHYWGRGKAEDLARTLRATLDTQGNAKTGKKAHKK